MASLYEINNAIMDCIDSETGEIIDFKALDALMIQREEKIENVALWIKNLTADAAAYKAEEEAFAERRAAAVRKADSLKRYLVHALDGEKFATKKCAISFRKSEQVEVYEESSIPEEYLNITYLSKPDKKAIKAGIKAGQVIGGCRLIDNLSVKVK